MRCPRSRDISSQICSKIARSRLRRPCLSAYISGTRARIGKRFSPFDRAGSEVSKNVVKKISRPNPPGRDLRKFESVYLRIADSTRSAVDRKFLKMLSKKFLAPTPPAETLGSLKACISGSPTQRGQRSKRKPRTLAI